VTYYSGFTKPVEVHYGKGDEIVFLQYRAEGECLIANQGEVIAVECCPWLADNSELVLAAPPTYETWVQPVDANEKPLGWALADGSLIVETDRRF
jgi:hypothetical protein